jgi:hypothetical protein
VRFERGQILTVFADFFDVCLCGRLLGRREIQVGMTFQALGLGHIVLGTPIAALLELRGALRAAAHTNLFGNAMRARLPVVPRSDAHRRDGAVGGAPAAPGCERREGGQTDSRKHSQSNHWRNLRVTRVNACAAKMES